MRFLFVGPKLCPCWHFSAFTSGFLQIPPRDGHPCLRLAVPATEPAVDFHHLVIAHAGRTAKNSRNLTVSGIHLEVTPGFEPGNQGFADPCLTTWLCHHRRHLYYMRLFSKSPHLFLDFDAHTFVWASSGAGNEARTRYLHLGKVALYQMSYARKWCLRSELNQRHADFQSAALPTELQRHMATKMGLEPTTSSVTG